MAGYLCVGKNKVGTMEKLFSLTVQGKTITGGGCFRDKVIVTGWYLRYSATD